MLDKNDVIARLAKGEDAQAIADELADILNAAIAEHTAAQEKEKEAAAKYNMKVECANNIFVAILDFLEAYYPDLYDASAHKISGEDWIAMLDDATVEIKKLRKQMENLDQFLKDYEAIKEQSKAKTKAKDPIAEFLSEYVDN